MSFFSNAPFSPLLLQLEQKNIKNSTSDDADPWGTLNVMKQLSERVREEFGYRDFSRGTML